MSETIREIFLNFYQLAQCVQCFWKTKWLLKILYTEGSRVEWQYLRPTSRSLYWRLSCRLNVTAPPAAIYASVCCTIMCYHKHGLRSVFVCFCIYSGSFGHFNHIFNQVVSQLCCSCNSNMCHFHFTFHCSPDSRGQTWPSDRTGNSCQQQVGLRWTDSKLWRIHLRILHWQKRHFLGNVPNLRAELWISWTSRHTWSPNSLFVPSSIYSSG